MEPDCGSLADGLGGGLLPGRPDRAPGRPTTTGAGAAAYPSPPRSRLPVDAWLKACWRCPNAPMTAGGAAVGGRWRSLAVSSLTGPRPWPRRCGVRRHRADGFQCSRSGPGRADLRFRSSRPGPSLPRTSPVPTDWPTGISESVPASAGASSGPPPNSSFALKRHPDSEHDQCNRTDRDRYVDQRQLAGGNAADKHPDGDNDQRRR